ncbi:MAG: hypothetical protein AAGF12_37770, partial [Myxococcota bacterium]
MNQGEPHQRSLTEVKSPLALGQQVATVAARPMLNAVPTRAAGPTLPTMPAHAAVHLAAKNDIDLEDACGTSSQQERHKAATLLLVYA